MVRGSGVRFSLLGSFEVSVDGGAVPVGGGPVGRAVLALLVRRPGEVVLPDKLIAGVWGEGGVSADSLYHHVARLRAALAPVGVRVLGCRPGYRVEVEPDRVDAHRFDQLLCTARRLRDTDPAEAARRLRDALDLWRGPAALPDLPGPAVRALATELNSRRLDAEEDLALLELDDAHRAEVVLDRLRTLTANHPNRGGLSAALIRALHATGRTDEALAVYQRVHDRATRHGRDTQRALRRAHQHVLAAPAPQPARAPTAPFQLPAATTHFTGRISELDHLLYQWPSDESTPSTLVLTAVDGMAGVGKTALAVLAAHHLARRFPDGVLFIDLHGFTPDTEPTTPDAALDYLLRGLGVPVGQIPPRADARVALYHSVLVTRRVLVVLDNAADEAQVRPLLPATRSCLTLITSRRRLTGLCGAGHLTLDTLHPAEAIALFTRIAGERASSADQDTIEHIVAACGHLPLAIRIIAARLAISRALTPAGLLRELNTHNRADTIAVLDDGRRSVAAVFAVSFEHLTADQQTAFARLGLHPGPDLELHAAAALLDTDLDHTRTLLDQLEQANLLDQYTPGRHRLHNLTRAYAEHLTHGTPSDRRATLGRLLDHYAHVASTATGLVYPWETDQRPRPPSTRTPQPPLGDGDLAKTWLTSELDNLLAAADRAPAHGRPDHTIHQSAVLQRHLRVRGRYADAATLHSHALDVAGSLGDSHGEVDAQVNLARVRYTQGCHTEAANILDAALRTARAAGHRGGEQTALTGLGYILRARREHEQAAHHLSQALQVARVLGHRSGEIDASLGVGHVHRDRGRHEDAGHCYDHALRLAKDIGHHAAQFEALDALGRCHHAAGRHTTALRYHRRALSLAVDLDQSADQTRAHDGLATTYHALGDHALARTHWTTALDILTALGADRTYDPQVTTTTIRDRLDRLTEPVRPSPTASTAQRHGSNHGAAPRGAVLSASWPAGPPTSVSRVRTVRGAGR